VKNFDYFPLSLFLCWLLLNIQSPEDLLLLATVDHCIRFKSLENDDIWLLTLL